MTPPGRAILPLTRLGAVAVQAGDLPAAKARFEESLDIRKKLAQANPTSVQTRRDLSVSLERLGDVAMQVGDLPAAKARVRAKLGDVAVQAGDLPAAKARFEEGLGIDRKLAQANPTSTEAQRDVFVSLFRLGRITRDRKLLREAFDIIRELDRTGRLAPRDRPLLQQLPKLIEALP